jgi:hypothetical protein
MKKQRLGMGRDGLESDPPQFICQEMQCSVPLLTWVGGAEEAHSMDRGESDLREDIPVKKKNAFEGLGRY